MATFIYKSIHDDSQVCWGAGRYPFNDVESLNNFLERSGQTIVHSFVMPVPVESVLSVYYRLRAKKIPSDDLVEYLRNTGIMLKTGVPFVEVIKEAADASDSNFLRHISRGIAMAIESGLGVHAALCRYEDVFPVQMLHIIRIGEESSKLDQAFLSAAEHVKRVSMISVDVKKALLYPVISMFAAVLASLFWLYYTIPAMSDLYRQMGLALPPITLTLLGFADLFRLNSGKVLFFLISLIVIIRLLYVCNGHCRFAWQNVVMHLPVFGKVTKHACIAYFSEYFSMLLRAGVDPHKALGIISDAMDNEAFKRAILKIQEGVASGNSISSEMQRQKLFPGMVCRIVRTGEQTGTLSQQLDFIANEYVSRLANLIGKVKALVEPIAIVIVGVLMIVIVIAMFFPVYNIILQMSGVDG